MALARSTTPKATAEPSPLMARMRVTSVARLPSGKHSLHSKHRLPVSSTPTCRRRALCRAPEASRVACAGAAALGAQQLKTDLIQLLGDGGEGTARMARVADKRRKLEQLVDDLCKLNPTTAPVESPMLLGRWQLLTTYKPGTADVQFFSTESWRKYIFEQGPSPVQSLVLGNTKSVAGVSQLLEDPANPGSRWQNVVAFGEGNQLVIEAELEGIKDESSFFYRFSGGFFKLKDGTKVPYPVPFGVLEALRPGQTRGWFSTLYLDEDFRVSMGNKGSIFVLQRPPGDLQAAAAEPLIK